MKATIKNINAQLPEGIEIVKGNGYFYFASQTVEEIYGWTSTSVYVYKMQGLDTSFFLHAFDALAIENGSELRAN